MGPKVYRAPNENPSDTLSIYPPSCIAGLYLVLLFASSQYIDSIDIYAVIISYIYMHAHMGRGGKGTVRRLGQPLFSPEDFSLFLFVIRL